MNSRPFSRLILLFVLSLMLCCFGCLGDGDDSENDDGETPTDGDEAKDELGDNSDYGDYYWDDDAPPDDNYWAEPDEEPRFPFDSDSGYPEDGDTPADGDSPVDGEWPEDGDEMIDGDSPDGDVPSEDGDTPDGDQYPDIEPGQLTAGEWRDLDNWSFWLDILQYWQWSQMVTYWDFNTSFRIPVEITAYDEPVIDAEVLLLDGSDEIRWIARSNNAGRAELFPKAFMDTQGPYSIRVKSGQNDVTIQNVQIPQGQQADMEPLAIELDSSVRPDWKMDLMLVIDATGSMGDEIQYLQSEFKDVVERVMDRQQDLAIRSSINYYRDRGDSFIVDSNPFTDNLNTAISDLNSQSASGGGDFPEAVDLALKDAILEHQWSESATARILFLVLDAPPHHEGSILWSLHASTALAAQKGISIIPITASGIDKETEFLMRFFSIMTNGTYVFITDHSGIGGGHLDPYPTIGEYQVELLNELMFRLILEKSQRN